MAVVYMSTSGTGDSFSPYVGLGGNILQAPPVPSKRGVQPQLPSRPLGVHVRPLLLLPLSAALAFALGLASPAARAQANSLPDIGSSAGQLLTPAEEQQYGEFTLFQLRHY